MRGPSRRGRGQGWGRRTVVEVARPGPRSHSGVPSGRTRLSLEERLRPPWRLPELVLRPLFSNPFFWVVTVKPLSPPYHPVLSLSPPPRLPSFFYKVVEVVRASPGPSSVSCCPETVERRGRRKGVPTPPFVGGEGGVHPRFDPRVNGTPDTTPPALVPCRRGCGRRSPRTRPPASRARRTTVGPTRRPSLAPSARGAPRVARREGRKRAPGAPPPLARHQDAAPERLRRQSPVSVLGASSPRPRARTRDARRDRGEPPRVRRRPTCGLGPGTLKGNIWGPSPPRLVPPGLTARFSGQLRLGDRPLSVTLSPFSSVSTSWGAAPRGALIRGPLSPYFSLKEGREDGLLRTLSGSSAVGGLPSGPIIITEFVHIKNRVRALTGL